MYLTFFGYQVNILFLGGLILFLASLVGLILSLTKNKERIEEEAPDLPNLNRRPEAVTPAPSIETQESIPSLDDEALYPISPLHRDIVYLSVLTEIDYLKQDDNQAGVTFYQNILKSFDQLEKWSVDDLVAMDSQAPIQLAYLLLLAATNPESYLFNDPDGAEPTFENLMSVDWTNLAVLMDVMNSELKEPATGWYEGLNADFTFMGNVRLSEDEKVAQAHLIELVDTLAHDVAVFLGDNEENDVLTPEMVELEPAEIDNALINLKDGIPLHEMDDNSIYVIIQAITYYLLLSLSIVLAANSTTTLNATQLATLRLMAEAYERRSYHEVLEVVDWEGGE